MASPSELCPSFPGDGGAMAEAEDAFLGFVEYARSLLLSSEEERGSDGGGPPWSWIVSRILKTCAAYSSGVTPAILLSDLFQAWSEQNRYVTSKKRLECMVPLKSRQRRTRLLNTVTIDSIYEKNFLSLSSVLEAIIVDAFFLPGTNIYMLSLGDVWSSCTIDLYLHCRYYHLVDPNNGILRKGREIFLTGCCLRTAMEGSGHPRLLPTEYLVILLDADQDQDAMLLGVCSDPFSSILTNAVKDGSSCSFSARIESIGPLEVQGTLGGLQRKQITLVDYEDKKMNFLLWGDQILLANLFSVGSTLALDRPFIADSTGSNIENGKEICLEYGSATQLYLVPYIQHEEQVLLTSTQMRYQGSSPSCSLGQSQGLKLSQVSLPLDSQGYIDLRNYPFRSYIIDLRDKMTGISLYGVVASINREKSTAEIVFCMTIEDVTGRIPAKLHFVRSWSLGRLGLGHMIYIAGLTCSMTTKKLLEVSWFEKEPGTSLINLSCLPGLLNSSCLHKLSYLSDISNRMNTMHICRVHLDRLEHHHIHSMPSHSLCGHSVNEISDGSIACSFCDCCCDGELTRSFYLNVTLADESAKVSAWCLGQIAAELLQISPDEFYELPEDEQAMYLFTIGNDDFMVALVNSSCGLCTASNQANVPIWEIARAQKCD